MCNVNMMKEFKPIKIAFTRNPDEISSRGKTSSGTKKILFTREIHPRMKFNFKENL